MNQTEEDIFEEYKRLDRLCSDMFGLPEGGVSEYIKAMEEAPEKLKAKIETWQGDYKKLKHLRWVRNKIAHEIDFEEYTDEDLEDIKYYYLRIMKGTDSLSLLEKSKKSVKPKQQPSGKAQNPEKDGKITKSETNFKEKDKNKNEAPVKSESKFQKQKNSAPLTMAGFFFIFAAIVAALIIAFVIVNK